MGFLDQEAILFLVFSGTFILFSIVAALICFLTNSVLGFTSSPTSVISCVFDNSHSNRCEVIAFGFDLHFHDEK